MPFDPSSFADIGSGAAGGGIVGAIVGLYNKFMGDRKFDKLDEALDKQKAEFAEYKLDALRIYATRVDLTEVKEDMKYIRKAVDDIRVHLSKRDS